MISTKKIFIQLTIFLIITTLATTIVSSVWNTPGVPVQDTTASKTSHNDQGPRRIARIGETIIALANGPNDDSSSEGVYRSLDNGATWSLIHTEPFANRGTIITGPNNTFFIFWLSNNPSSRGIHMLRFTNNSLPQNTEVIYSGDVSTVASGGYQQISASIDEQGTIYLAAQYISQNDGLDKIWFLKSTDGGNTWTSPTIIYDEPGVTFYTPHIIVDHSGNLLVTFNNIEAPYPGGVPNNEDKRIHLARSSDGGNTWSTSIVDNNPSTGGSLANPVIIESKNNNLFIFAQRSGQGLVMSRSTDGGNTWTPFSVIYTTGRYADPSAAIGSDGAIYVTFRSDRDSSGNLYSNLGYCPSGTYYCWKNSMITSNDEGNSWTLVDVNLEEDRTGPANSLRYQNWWNYGGPLEWTWQQYLSSNTNHRPVFYDNNLEITIYDRSSESQNNNPPNNNDNNSNNSTNNNTNSYCPDNYPPGMIYCEDFDDQDLDQPPRGYINWYLGNWVEAIEGQHFVLNATGHSGYAMSDIGFNANDAHPVWFNPEWSSDELYVSFWQRYEAIQPETYPNIKTFYPHWDGTSSYVHFTLAGPDSLYYSTRSQSGTMIDLSRYPDTPGITDGSWHHLEFWIKFSTAQIKFWYDGSLVLDEDYPDTTNGIPTWTNNIYYITAFKEDAGGDSIFTRQLDEWEVWDRLPTQPICTDNDGDNFNASQTGCGITDCDDNNASIFPGAPEICGNNVDEDCDGTDLACSTICGNGIVESGEDCDDGNTVTESCSYGLTSCQVCDSSCQLVSGSTSFCGDSNCDNTFEDSNSCPQDCSTTSSYSCPDPYPPGMISCEDFDDGAVNAPQISFTCDDPTSYYFSSENTYGNTGMSFRSTHVLDDGSDNDCIFFYNNATTDREFFIKYSVRYDPNYEWGSNVKLLKFSSGSMDLEGAWNPGTNGPDSYHLYMTDDSGNMLFNNWHESWGGILTNGQWHNVSYYIKGNSPGLSDGIIQFWIDGSLSTNETGLTFFSNPTDWFSVNQLISIRGISNNGPTTPSIGRGWWMIDNIQVWDQPPTTQNNNCPNNSCSFNPDINSDSNVSFIDLLLFGRDFGSIYDYNDFNVLVSAYS